jgi:hypothetical protein
VNKLEGFLKNVDWDINSSIKKLPPSSVLISRKPVKGIRPWKLMVLGAIEINLMGCHLR